MSERLNSEIASEKKFIDAFKEKKKVDIFQKKKNDGNVDIIMLRNSSKCRIVHSMNTLNVPKWYMRVVLLTMYKELENLEREKVTSDED